MKKTFLTLICLIALTGCVHQELRAPCSPTASLAANGDGPCQHKPINFAERGQLGLLL